MLRKLGQFCFIVKVLPQVVGAEGARALGMAHKSNPYKKARSMFRWKWKKKRTRRLQKKRRKMRQRSK